MHRVVKLIGDLTQLVVCEAGDEKEDNADDQNESLAGA